MKIMEHYQSKAIPVEQQKDMISVIVAIYNIAEYIEKGVVSILRQTYRNLEIILVDDGSADESGKICDRLAESDARIVVLHKENGGLADARNAGMAIAKGSFIGFVDGDDWIDENMYEKMMSAMLEQQAELAVCRYKRVYRDHTEDASTDSVVLFEGQEALQCYIEERKEYDIQSAAWNKLYRKEVLKGMHFPTGKWYEDIMVTTTILSKVNRCVYLDSACYNYIIDREGSIMNARIGSRVFTDMIPTYREKVIFLQKLGRQDLADTHEYFINKRLLLLYNQLKKDRFPDRKQYLRELTKIIYEDVFKDEEHYQRVYHCNVANPNDKRKMDLFLKSPRLYWIVMILNEAVILPIKVRRIRRRQQRSQDVTEKTKA